MQMVKKQGPSVDELIDDVEETIKKLQEENSRSWGIGYSEGFQAGLAYKETFWQFLKKRLRRE